MNQMRVNHNVVCSKISDFEIDGATFEIGGKKFRWNIDSKGWLVTESTGKPATTRWFSRHYYEWVEKCNGIREKHNG